MLHSLSRLSPRVGLAFAAWESCTVQAWQHAIRRCASTGTSADPGQEVDVVIALGTNMVSLEDPSATPCSLVAAHAPALRLAPHDTIGFCRC